MQSVPFFASGEQCQAEFCLHFRVGILEQFQESRHGDGGFACGGYLTLFKELGQKQTQQQSRGRKINAMDAYFYQMVERVLREELAVVFGESPEEAGRRLLSVLN